MTDLRPIATLRRVTPALAMLDAIVSPDNWAARRFSFDAQWAPGEQLASLRMGEGDEGFLWFGAGAATVKVFAHEQPGDAAYVARVLRELPPACAPFAQEPAFDLAATSGCAWCTDDTPGWHAVQGGPWHPDSLAPDLRVWQGTTDAALWYQRWSRSYWGVDLPMDALRAVFAHQPLSDALALILNPHATPQAWRDEAHGTGYPCAE